MKPHQWLSSRTTTRLAFLFVMLLMATPTGAQSNATESACLCSPRVYDITLDFSRTCQDNGGFGTGVQEVGCNILPFDDPSDTDLVPEIVTLIDVSELGQNLQTIVNSQRFTGMYENGATLAISSVSDGSEELEDLPKAFQMNMIGVNANGGTIVFSGLIVYTSACEDYPVLLVGASNGWALLTEQVPPNADLCPAAGETDLSSLAPSMALTLPPVAGETFIPSAATSSEATVIPTVAPIVPDSPTRIPVASRTIVPSTSTDESRTVVPTTNPAASRTVVPTTNQGASPTVVPTTSPVVSPMVTTTTSPGPDASRTVVPTTSTVVPTEILGNNPPTMNPTRTKRPTTMSESPAPGKHKKVVCTHIKKDSKSGTSENVSQSNKGSKSSKGSKKGDAKKKKENKSSRRSSKKGKRRILNEPPKSSAYFRIFDDTFRERDKDSHIVNDTTGKAPAATETTDYLTIYKEVFQDADCYEIDTYMEPHEITLVPSSEENRSMQPSTSPTMSVETPGSVSNPLITTPPPATSSMTSSSPSTATPPSLVPTVIIMPSSNVSSSPSANVSVSFEDLLLNSTDLNDRSGRYVTTPSTTTASSNDDNYYGRRNIAFMNACVIMATLLWMERF